MSYTSLLVINLHCRCRHHLSIEIHASAFVLLVPSVPSKRDWLTLQDCDNKERNDVSNVQTNRRVRQPLERHLWEDAQVGEDDRYLDQR